MILRDAAFAIRAWRRRPTFAAIAIGAIAIGAIAIGIGVPARRAVRADIANALRGE